MEPPKLDRELKLPNMVMCGDHPSFTKTELNMKEIKAECKEKEKEKDKKASSSFVRISPSSSRTKSSELERARLRPTSEHALRTLAKPRSSSEYMRPDYGNKELVQATLGSFRWPPYLVCAWVLAVAAAHALHALAALLGAVLPTLRNLCQYFRAWTERSWRAAGGGGGGGGEEGSGGEVAWRVRPALLAAVTALLYAACGALSCAHALALWALQPQCEGERDGREGRARVTDYMDASELHIDHVK